MNKEPHKLTKSSAGFRPRSTSSTSAARRRLGVGLQGVGTLLLVIGFAGPWLYGPLGKSQDWGWQPVWGLLLSIVALNIFALVGLGSCFSYVELAYRRGEPPLRAVLQWIGGFVGLVVLLPLVVWSVFDLIGSSPRPQQADGTLGWGVWVAVIGLLVQISGLRLLIEGIKAAAKSQS